MLASSNNLGVESKIRPRNSTGIASAVLRGFSKGTKRPRAELPVKLVARDQNL
jgi:hypothetical protein